MKMKIPTKEEICFMKSLIKHSVLELKNNDMNLFDYHTGKEKKTKSLHETCINHRLAVYIEKYLEERNLNYYVDIEYNKNNYLPKELYAKDICKEVRPDIIVHTREKIKGNFLILEAKKDEDAPGDEEKIKAFIEDREYSYQFGCKIKYGNLQDDYKITLFYSRDGNTIIEPGESIDL